MINTIASKVFSFGKFPISSKKRVNEVTIEMELRKNENGKMVLSICGDVWNSRHTDCIIGGQCIDSILDECPSLRFNELYMKLYGLWKRNHLNDMIAGSHRQEEAVKDWEKQGNEYTYATACEMLKKLDLYEDKEYIYEGKPYKYGTAWLYRDISNEDMNSIKTLLKM